MISPSVVWVTNYSFMKIQLVDALGTVRNSRNSYSTIEYQVILAKTHLCFYSGDDALPGCVFQIIATKFIHWLSCFSFKLQVTKRWLEVYLDSNVKRYTHGKTCALLNSVQKFNEIQDWLLPTFFICLHNQLSSFNSIIVKMSGKRDLSNRQ